MKRSITIITILVMLLALSVLFISCGKCDHSYDNDCDTSCNKCGEERTVEGHSYTTKGYDDHYHYQRCSICGEINEESKKKHVLNDEYTCECGVEYTVKKDGEIETSAIVSLYNSKDLHVRSIFYEQGEITYYFEDYYNENGDVIKSENYDSDGNLTEYLIFEYNQNGDFLKDSVYDSDGELIIYTLYHYDENGFLIKQEDIEGDGTLLKYTLYTNDENGNRIKKEDYSFDGTLEDT